jgi:hypothetical protein
MDGVDNEEMEEGEKDLKVFAFDVAKCSEEEKSRLFSRRFGYCNPDLLVKMNEDKDFGVLPKFVKLKRIISSWTQPNSTRRHTTEQTQL